MSKTSEKCEFRTSLSITWPTGFISILILIILLVSVISEKLGIHAFLGAFLVGAAIESNGNEKNEVYNAIAHFALSFFAPIYFVSMGLNVNFINNFSFNIVLIILIVASISKIGAVILGAWFAGMPINRETLAIGFGLNVRGATGIILAGVGFEYKLINEQIFVAMIVMSLITSLISGPMIKYLRSNKDYKCSI